MTQIRRTTLKKFTLEEGRKLISKKDLDDYLSPSPHRYTAVAALFYFARKWGLHEEILND